MTERSLPELRRLRRRLTGVFALAAALGLAASVAALVLTDTAAERRQLDERLKGDASRAAALVYLDEAGRPQTDGLVDDHSTAGPASVVVFDGRLRVLFSTGPADPADAAPLGRRALGDAAELGSWGRVDSRGIELRAAAMPWFSGVEKVGGAAVVLDRPATVRRDRLLVPGLMTGGALLVVLTAGAWLLAGRSMRPAEAALADRERFLATAAHELCGPLARLRAGAEAARRGAPPPQAATLHRLVTIADSAGQVVSNLLLATRIDHAEVPLRAEPVRLDQLAGELEHGVDGLVVDVREPMVVTGDAGLLRHAVTNLVDNAVRHGRVGATAPAVLLRVYRRGGAPVVEVSDDGPGFPADTDVLARYVSGPTGGTGLGLPLVVWIAERHGASVRLGAPAYGTGGMVEIAFPLPANGGRVRHRRVI